MSLKAKKILVTCGPVWSRIDDVRVISNISSGQLGQTLAAGLERKGARVTLLLGPVTQPLTLTRSIRVRRFQYFDELQRLLAAELKNRYHAVIHAAAVSDYRVRNSSASKIPSGKTLLTLKLAPHPKLIDTIKKRAPRTRLVGFKLIPAGSDAILKTAANALLRKAHCDWVVANRIRRGYRGLILDQSGSVRAAAAAKHVLVQRLIKTLESDL